MEELINSSTEVEVVLKRPDPVTGNLVQVLSASAKLTKADAGRAPGDVAEEYIWIRIKPGTQPNYADASISIDKNEKLTKADAG